MTGGDVAALIAVALAIATSVGTLVASRSRQKTLERQIALLDGLHPKSRVRRQLQSAIDWKIAAMLARGRVVSPPLTGLFLWFVMIMAAVLLVTFGVGVAIQALNKEEPRPEMPTGMIISAVIVYLCFGGLFVRAINRRLAIRAETLWIYDGTKPEPLTTRDFLLSFGRFLISKNHGPLFDLAPAHKNQENADGEQAADEGNATRGERARSRRGRPSPTSPVEENNPQ